MRWSEQVSATTGIEAWDRQETDLVLDLARDVAHGTERRFAPLTAYAVGVAVGARLGEAATTAAGRHEVLSTLVADLVEATGGMEPSPGD